MSRIVGKNTRIIIGKTSSDATSASFAVRDFDFNASRTISKFTPRKLQGYSQPVPEEFNCELYLNFFADTGLTAIQGHIDDVEADPKGAVTDAPTLWFNYNEKIYIKLFINPNWYIELDECYLASLDIKGAVDSVIIMQATFSSYNYPKYSYIP